MSGLLKKNNVTKTSYFVGYENALIMGKIVDGVSKIKNTYIYSKVEDLIDNFDITKYEAVVLAVSHHQFVEIDLLKKSKNNIDFRL